MPTFRDITVHVTDASNEPLTEHGIHKRERAGLSTCYVQSKTDMQFRILIKPGDKMFPYSQREEGSSSEEGSEDGEAKETKPRWPHTFMTGREVGFRYLTFPPEDEYEAVQREHEGQWLDEFGRTHPQRDQASWQHIEAERKKYLPIASLSAPVTKWHLLATLRLDGRKGFETRCIIYLDKGHAGYGIWNGEYKMKYRLLRDSEGTLRECRWLFKEVGIETVFDSLRLSSGEKDTVPAQDEEELVSSFQGLGANGLEDAEEKSSVGQIEVTLERITVVGETEDDVWRPNPNQDDHMGGLASRELSAMTHTAARDTGTKKVEETCTTSFRKVNKNEEPYATFKFYYRGEGTYMCRRLLDVAQYREFC